MKYYKEYLIPETIDHKELKYLVSIGSKVLVKANTNIGVVIGCLTPITVSGFYYDFSPLSHSDIVLLESRSIPIYSLYYKIT